MARPLRVEYPGAAGHENRGQAANKYSSGNPRLPFENHPSIGYLLGMKRFLHSLLLCLSTGIGAQAAVLPDAPAYSPPRSGQKQVRSGGAAAAVEDAFIGHDPKTGDVVTQKIDVDDHGNAARTFSFTQTTRGQLRTVTDSSFGAAPYATLEHNADGMVTSEANTFTGVTLARGTDGLGRINNVSLVKDGQILYSVPIHRTDGLQRFDGTGDYAWTFVDGTSLIDVVTLGNGFTIDYDYDEFGKTYRLTTITFRKNDVDYYVINFGNNYDARDRIKAATSKMSFPDLPTLDFNWSFNYGSFNQLGGQSSVVRMIHGEVPDDPAAEAFVDAFPEGAVWNFAFDAIGNDQNPAKKVNRLNQLIRRSNPFGVVTFNGSVYHDAVVTLNGRLPASRASINDVQGNPTDLDSYAFSQVYDNENSPIRKMLEFKAVRFDKDLNKDVISTRYALLQMPQAIENFAFDGRGNRLETAMCDLSYTARNRMETASSKMIKKLIPAPNTTLSVNGNEYTVSLEAPATVSYLRLETAGDHSAAQLNATLQALVGGVWTAPEYPDIQLFHNPITDKTILFLGIANPVVAAAVRATIGGTAPPTFSAATTGDVTTDEPLKKEKGKVGYKYDFFGRRVEKKIYSWAETAWKTTPDEIIKFVYDGWLLLAELDGKNGNALLRSYVWGPDLSGTRSGVAGIGGLLAVNDHSTGKTYHPFTDGRGNVMGYVDSDTGQVVATYLYDPFGNTIGQWGELANTFKFRFSTKYFDVETETYYYGYRDYDPDTKTWLTRDPLGEAGGMNLYAFCSNNPINNWDPTGLDPIADAFLFFTDPNNTPLGLIMRRTAGGRAAHDSLQESAAALLTGAGNAGKNVGIGLYHFGEDGGSYIGGKLGIIDPDQVAFKSGAYLFIVSEKAKGTSRTEILVKAAAGVITAIPKQGYELGNKISSNLEKGSAVTTADLTEVGQRSVGLAITVMMQAQMVKSLIALRNSIGSVPLSINLPSLGGQVIAMAGSNGSLILQQASGSTITLALPTASTTTVSLAGQVGVVVMMSGDQGYDTGAQDIKLTKHEIRKLTDRIKKDGYPNVESLKSTRGKNAGKLDLYKKPNGDIVTKPKGGAGLGNETGYNIVEL